MTDILKIINDSKLIIDKSINIFLFNLFKFIFIKRKKAQDIENRLTKYIDKINKQIIKKKEDYINKDYTKENFKKIIEFVKKQNKLYSGEIIEGILIYTFSHAFYSDKDNTLGKYVYSNLYKFKDPQNYDIINMFKQDKFYPRELKDLKELLLIDATWEDRDNDRINRAQRDCVIYNLLYFIFIEKYINIKEVKNNNKSMYYINRGLLDNQKISETIYNKLKDNSMTILDKDITTNSIMSLASNLYYSGEYGKISPIPIRLIRALLIQVFIYYQNKNSPLMNYITKDENYDPIPFVYDLRGACVEGRFALIILSPVRIEPRINRISLSQNNLRECGLYEMGKAILFNKNIKVIEFNTSLLRTNYIDFLNNALGIFDNYSVEVLNISFNYLKDNCEEYLAKLITYFKGLKTINLNANEFKRGICSFLIVLKNLYRQGNTKLEKLLINKCLLDEGSYYELGELLKCKYCKLKKLYLNFNTLPSNINFLKKLKKNKSLTEIFINKNEIGNNEVDDILRIISNTNVRYLYLYKNKISSPNQFLDILYRTKLIKKYNNNDNEKDKDNIININNINEKENNIINDKNNANNINIYNNIDNDNDNENDNDDEDDQEIIGDESYLINLDLSNNELYIKNQTHIKLMNTICKESTLYCLDISHILYGPSPEKKKITNDNAHYRKAVDDLKNYLEKEKKGYIKTLKYIRSNTVDKNRLNDLESEEMFKDLDKDIDDIISQENAKFPVFLRERASKLIDDDKNKELREIMSKKNIKIGEMEDRLLNYLIVKRSEKNLEQLIKIKKEHKLILI